MDFVARYRENEPHFQNLEEHLTETAQLAQVFGKPFGFGFLAQLSALLHDAGKASKNWQEYLRKSIEGKTQSKIDHSTAGAKLLSEMIENKTLALQAVQAAVMFHHGSGLPNMLCLDGKSEFAERLDKKLPESEFDEIRANIDEKIKYQIEKIIQSEEWQTDGRIALLDSCKNGCTSKKQLYFNMGLHLRNFASCLIDADRTDSAAFEANEKINLANLEKLPDWSSMLEKLENHLSKVATTDKLGKIRSYVSSRCADMGKSGRGIFTCSAITGSGKTLSSLRFALEQAKKHKMKRIFIVAPYTSIIDQNADVIRSVLEDENTRGQIVLECHSNLSIEKKSELKESEENYARFEETWSSPVVITTFVQFLETLFGSGTKNIRRMHQLAESVLVFDEIQTLPIKATFLFNWGLDYLVHCCGCSAMLCTATQPCLDKIGDEKYRLSFDAEVIGDLNAHFSSLERVRFVDKTDGGTKKSSVSEILDYIKTQLDLCGSFLAVVNTKPQAKELFELVKESGCADYVYHLSTNMCPAHRRVVIAEMKKQLENGEKVVCVSTRLIEAGVDVSFGGALRYLAGLDSIIQTAGRCNRNGELKDESGNSVLGTLAIFDAEDENLGSLEELKTGKECMERVLRDFRKDWSENNCRLIDQKVIEAFFNYYYAKFSTALLKYSVRGKETSLLDMLSDNLIGVHEYERINGNQGWKKMPYRQAFKTAWENFEVITDSTIGIIVPYGDGANIIGELCALEKTDADFYSKFKSVLKKSQQFTVNVYANQLLMLGKEGMIFEVLHDSGIYALREEFYSKNTGLKKEGFTDESSISVLNF